MTNINHEALNEAVYLYAAGDERNDWCLPKDYPGYEPQVDQYVHIRKVAPGYIQRGLNMTVQNRSTPVTYQVVEVIPRARRGDDRRHRPLGKPVRLP